MAYSIAEICVACGACMQACPVQAIIPGDVVYEIEPEKCIDCGSCADVCPVEAISPA